METLPSAFKKLNDNIKDVEETYIHSKEFRKLFKKILEQKLNESYASSISDYDKPAWAYYQAHKNGRTSAFKELINLL